MTLLPALDLRLRSHRIDPGPPDVDAFRKRCEPATRPRALAIVPGAAPLRRDAPVVVFFQHASYGIPRPGVVATLDVASWSVRATTFGYLASVPTRRSRSRTAWVIAICLPLALPSTAAAESPTEIQRPQKKKRPKSEPAEAIEAPADAEEPSDSAPVDPAIDPDADTAEKTVVETLLPPGDPPSDAEDDEQPPRPSAGDARAREQATLDAAWEGVDGYEVDLELKGGKQMRGQVSAIQADTFTLIEHATGQVLVLPKSGVVSLRVHMPEPLPVSRGGGLIAGGSVLTSIGAPVFISGVVMLGICTSCTSIHLPLLFVGGGALAGGIPMLVLGARRRHAYLEAVQARELAPVVMRTRDGWTGGLRFRF